MTVGRPSNGVMKEGQPTVGSDLRPCPLLEADRSKSLVDAPRALIANLERRLVDVAEPGVSAEGTNGAVSKPVIGDLFVDHDAHFNHPPFVRFLLLDFEVSSTRSRIATSIMDRNEHGGSWDG